VEANALRESRRANQRLVAATEGTNVLTKAWKEQKKSQNNSPTQLETQGSRKNKKPNNFC
jgi:hypothetical protein